MPARPEYQGDYVGKHRPKRDSDMWRINLMVNRRYINTPGYQSRHAA